MSVFIVVPQGTPCPPFFGSAVEALTEAAATGGDVYMRWGVSRREGMRIELAAADAALQTVVVAAHAESAAADANAPQNESDTSSVSAQSDEECSYCGEADCDRICGVVAKRVCREWEEADFLPPTWSASAPGAAEVKSASEEGSLPSGGPSF